VLAEDFEVFFNDDEFSEPCLLISQSRTISVIAENASELIPMGVVDVNAETLFFLAPAIDVQDLEEGQKVTINSVDHTVASNISDGTGLSVVSYF
jgi:hypothetical protein